MEPEKKKRKLNTALAAAIGANSQNFDKNIEKQIVLALTSDDKSAEGLLAKVQASHRAKEVLDLTLKICREKGAEAHVDEAFLTIFRKHFAVLGVESAKNCWNSLLENLKETKTTNEIKIVNEFIKRANLLGFGFSKLVQEIKSDLIGVIKRLWNENREFDSITISYSFICLLLAEHAYSDTNCSAENLWKSAIFDETMENSFELVLLTVLSESQGNGGKISKKLRKVLQKSSPSDNHQEIVSKIFLTHFEYFTAMLDEQVISNLLGTTLRSSLKLGNLKNLASRIRTTEVQISSSLEAAITNVIQDFGSFAEVEGIDSLEVIASKLEETPEIAKDYIKNPTKIDGFVEFLGDVFDIFEEPASKARHFLRIAQIQTIFGETSSKVSNTFVNSVKIISLDSEIFNVFYKKVKACETLKQLKKVFKNSRNGQESNGVTYNTKAEEVIQILENSTNLEKVVEVLKGVHQKNVKDEVFDRVLQFLEQIEGGTQLAELDVYKTVIEIYGSTNLETFCISVVLAKLAENDWVSRDRLKNEETNSNTWFEILTSVIDLLDLMIKSAKNSIIKTFSSVFCNLFTQLLKNVQKHVRERLNSEFSRHFTVEESRLNELRRHKLLQDVARIVDSMKRHEAYFSLLAASIISDTVFNGSSTILVMSKLHGLADKNASALLATNLDAIERTRYSKFLPIITKASRKVF